jgi:hypothetical protein
MNRDFEQTVIQNKIDELVKQLEFAFKVLGVPLNEGIVKYIYAIDQLQQWQQNMLDEKHKQIKQLEKMLDE